MQSKKITVGVVSIEDRNVGVAGEGYPHFYASTG